MTRLEKWETKIAYGRRLSGGKTRSREATGRVESNSGRNYGQETKDYTVWVERAVLNGSWKAAQNQLEG